MLKKAVDVVKFFLVLPVYLLLLWVDKHWHAWFRLDTPRNLSEILKRPRKLFDMLPESKQRGSELVRLKVERTHEAEPIKNDTSCMLRVEYKQDNQLKSSTVFVKFTGERQMPLFVKALAATYMTRHMEVEFGRQLAQRVPVPSPKFVSAKFSRAFQRALIVTKLLDPPYATLPDHTGADFTQIAAMLTSMARMHAAYWGDRALRPETEFLKERGAKGIDVYKSIELFIDRTDLSNPADHYFRPLWKTIHAFFADRTVCLQHGDFRPGNMLFLPRQCKCIKNSKGERKNKNNPNGSGCTENRVCGGWVGPDDEHKWDGACINSARAEDHAEAPPVIFADWEAVSIMPVMWDFMYLTVLSQDTDVRRQRHDKLLELYRAALLANGVPEADVSVKDLTIHTHVLGIVLAYYSWMLVQMKAVGEVQGNSEDDGRAWNRRIVRFCVTDIDTDLVATAMGCDRQLIVDFKLSMWNKPINAEMLRGVPKPE